jgi:1-phosphofructokinase family hexose kinase
MPVILVAGLTPAWQQIVRFDAFRLGEVNRAAEIHWCPSGKVLNVGLALARLGAAVTTLAPLGGPALAAAEREFTALGAAYRWIATEHPTRICTTILDSASGQTTELVENAAALSSDELHQFAAAFHQLAADAQLVVLTGSLTHGAPPTFFRDLAKSAPCSVLLDIRGPELLAALECQPLVVKPNREELAQTLGADLSDDAALRQAMSEMNQRGAQWVLVSSGAEPAWARSQAKLYKFAAAKVQVLNPIGSGDCLMAGLAAGISSGMKIPDAICLGMAAAAENAARLLPVDFDKLQVFHRQRTTSSCVAV